MKYHPEQKSTEIYLGNTSSKDKYTDPKGIYGSLKTIRFGSTAYDIEGEIINGSVHFPVFLGTHEEDLYEAIMTKELRRIRMGL